MPRDKKHKLSEGDKAIVAKAGVDNTARRTWDKDEFAAKAAEREKKASSGHGGDCKHSSIGWNEWQLLAAKAYRVVYRRRQRRRRARLMPRSGGG